MSTMTMKEAMKEAMKERHTVRKYTDKAIPQEIIKLLNERIAVNNEKYKLAIKLNINDTSAFNAIIKLIMAKGVKNYFVLAGPDTPDLDWKLGYCGADLMLYAQTLGLNTWWVGGTFNKSRVSAASGENRVIGIIAAGYGTNQGKPHKSKKFEEVVSYNGEIPAWFQAGVEAALLAPTAMNKQAFMLRGDNNEVDLIYDSGIFKGVDMGIIKYHFELGAGVENFHWKND